MRRSAEEKSGKARAMARAAGLVTILILVAAGAQAQAGPLDRAPGLDRDEEERAGCRVGFRAFPGRIPYLPGFGDEHATYEIMRYIHDPAVAIRVTGRFPFARYMSVQVYADDGTHYGAFGDAEIVPDEGSVNPFLPEVDDEAPNRSYTVWIVPEGSPMGGENTIEVPMPDNDPETPDDRLSICVRVYLPDDHRDVLGGVDLPTWESVYEATGAPSPCPQHLRYVTADTLGFVGEQWKKEPFGVDGDEIHFLRMWADDDYGNSETAYLGTYFDRSAGAVAVVRFLPLRFGWHGENPGGDDLRYWSFCLYGGILGTVGACLADEALEVADDGYVYIVFARRTPAIQAKVRRHGINLIPWGLHSKPLGVMRQIDANPECESCAHEVPLYEPPASPQELGEEFYYAENFVGEYAPVGRHCSELGFLRDLCGISELSD